MTDVRSLSRIDLSDEDEERGEFWKGGKKWGRPTSGPLFHTFALPLFCFSLRFPRPYYRKVGGGVHAGKSRHAFVALLRFFDFSAAPSDENFGALFLLGRSRGRRRKRRTGVIVCLRRHGTTTGRGRGDDTGANFRNWASVSRARTGEQLEPGIDL